MEYREEYTKLNEFYSGRLNNLIKRGQENPNSSEKHFLDECVAKNINFKEVLYKKLIDDYEEVNLETNKYQLLPMGLINKSIPSWFIKEEPGGVPTINSYVQIFLREPQFAPFYYPDDSKVPIEETFQSVCTSYIQHYKEALNESWCEEDFYKMLFSLKYLSIKYAFDLKENKVFAVGFFGTSVREGAGGKALTNAELYVMPAFRKLGIAKKMIALSFDLARSEGIENFDSITYRVQNQDSLSFLQSIGAKVSGLIHIEGNIPEMLEKLEKSNHVKR